MINRNSWTRRTLSAILFVVALGTSQQLMAQQAGQASLPASSQVEPASPPTQPTAPPAQAKSTSDPDPPKTQPTTDPNVPQNDRLFFALPNYLTVENASSLPPMTTGQKFKLVAQGTFDPVEFAFLALESGVNQANNSNPTFGQGFKGYGKRYALAFADNGIENFMSAAVFPSALREDPRYFQMGKGKFLHRAGYAAERVLVTRRDSGKEQFNYSEILGAGTAAAISNAYHPGPRTLGSNINIWWTQIGWDAAAFEMKEFWPDIHRYVLRQRHKS